MKLYLNEFTKQVYTVLEEKIQKTKVLFLLCQEKGTPTEFRKSIYSNNSRGLICSKAFFCALRNSKMVLSYFVLMGPLRCW